MLSEHLCQKLTFWQQLNLNLYEQKQQDFKLKQKENRKNAESLIQHVDTLILNRKKQAVQNELLQKENTTVGVK